MVRPRLWQWLLCAGAVLACGVVHAADDGQALLDKATDVKLTAESVADLNDVIKLCQDAIKAGLDEDNTKFANGLLASTLTQRAEMACVELFERPVDPGRARKIAQLAVADLEETIRIDANQAEAQFLLGRLYGQMGEPKKALKVLDEAIRLTADEPASRAKALLVRANLHQDPKDRLADFDEAAKIAPRDPNVLRFRGMFHLAQNNLDAAVADLTAAAEIDPKDSDTQEACGIAQALAQKYDESLESFSRAIELDPNAATAYVHRGRIRAIKGDMPGALRDVEHGLRLQPGAVQALQLHASLLGSAGKYDQALVDLNALRTAMPDNPEVLTQIAAVYQASKQLHKAVATYDHLLKNDPKNASAYRGRADTYLSLGKQNESIADYEAAGHVARRQIARRQAGHRAGQVGRRGDRIQAGPHCEHAGGSLCRNRRFRHGRDLVEEGRGHWGRPAQEPVAKRAGKLRSPPSVARGCASDRGSGRAGPARKGLAG